jgi:hypothetical protein
MSDLIHFQFAQETDPSPSEFNMPWTGNVVAPVKPTGAATVVPATNTKTTTTASKTSKCSAKSPTSPTKVTAARTENNDTPTKSTMASTTNGDTLNKIITLPKKDGYALNVSSPLAPKDSVSPRKYICCGKGSFHDATANVVLVTVGSYKFRVHDYHLKAVS